LKIAIHQPNFIPWAGYFYKLLCADKFIFFDTVQFPRGKSYCSRAKIKTPGGERWLTVPVSSKGKLLPIRDVQIAGDSWIKKHLGTIKGAYGKAPFFTTFISDIRNLYHTAPPLIADLNIELITYLSSVLGAKTELIRASSLNVPLNQTDNYIVTLVKSMGGTVYITGQGEGTKRYMNERLFCKTGIQVEYLHYKDVRYPQLWGDFVPGLSTLDVLLNTGPQARDIILSGGM